MEGSCSCKHEPANVQKGGGWYGVDLDGTLARPLRTMDGAEIGAPIAGMVTKVKELLKDGREVRIFTARAAAPKPGVIDAIKKWCKEHLGQELEVTNSKDHKMIELWDDRARRVDSETGEFIKGRHGQAESDPTKYFDVFDVTDTKELKFKKATERPEIVRRLTFQGLPIDIETDRGQIRYFRGGQVKLTYPYGYIRRTEGADGDEIDIFVGPNTDSQAVYVIHTRKKPSFTTYDEDKVMVGFESPREAKAAFLENYDDRRFFGSMTETTIDDFKRIFVTAKSLDAGLVGQPPPPPMPMAPMGGMPGMMPGMGMMGMGPPPIDVETFEGVQQLLGRIGTVPDQQLMEIASTIWGSGYMFEGQVPDQARQEIIGFLLDQRDLLGVAPDPLSMQQSPSSPVQADPGSSDYSAVSTTSAIAAPAGQQAGVPSSVAESPSPSLMTWFEQGLSPKSA